MLSQAQRNRDSGTEHAAREQTGDRAEVLGGLARSGAHQSYARTPTRIAGTPHRTEKAETSPANRSWSFSAAARGHLVRVPMRNCWRAGRSLSYNRVNGVLPAAWNRTTVPPTPAGQYAFAPVERLQHDTSPHELELGGKEKESADRIGSAFAIRGCCSSSVIQTSGVSTARYFSLRRYASWVARPLA